MNIQVDPTSSNLASAMLNSKIRPRAIVGYGVKIFHPSPPNYVTRSPGKVVDLYSHKMFNVKLKITIYGGCTILFDFSRMTTIDVLNNKANTVLLRR